MRAVVARADALRQHQIPRQVDAQHDARRLGPQRLGDLAGVDVATLEVHVPAMSAGAARASNHYPNTPT